MARHPPPPTPDSSHAGASPPVRPTPSSYPQIRVPTPPRATTPPTTDPAKPRDATTHGVHALSCPRRLSL